MAFFLAPLGEIILEGMAAGMATNMGKEVYDTFAPKLKDGASDLIGQKIGGYAHDNPNGFVAVYVNVSIPANPEFGVYENTGLDNVPAPKSTLAISIVTTPLPG